MDDSEVWSEQGHPPGMGAAGGRAKGSSAQGGAVGWGSGTLASGPVESEDVGLHNHTVPTELQPQDAVPLGLGAEDADWTQDLPWRLEGLPTCSHWPSPFLHGGGFFKVDLPLGSPWSWSWAPPKTRTLLRLRPGY